ncbi:MAG: LacI family DNA-binding transcriptional regulator [Anaerolineae bacterium]|jgi:LacI family transcriptional regulator
MTERVTMEQVAREAGVSLMTVSRVVNDRDGVSQATRERVQAIIERLGYRPSDIARGLVTRRTATIGLVVPDVANPFFSEVARGVEHVAYEAGYNVFLCNTEEDTQRELGVLRSLEEKRVDGIVLCSSRLEEEQLEKALVRYPAAVLVNRRLGHDRIGVVLIEDEEGGRVATEHLLRAGHRAIGFLAGPPTSFSGQRRVAGFCVTLGTASLHCNSDWIRHCSPTVEGGHKVAHELLDAYPYLTALACYNDLVAVGALQACVELGRVVPDDTAVVGFDDIPLAALVTPSLTTCHIPRYELGAQAMRLLLDQINDVPSECMEVVLQPKLVVRASAP